MSVAIEVTPLGQAGFRLICGDRTVYIDPYLSDRVEQVEGAALRRLVPIWKSPAQVSDADWVLVTHNHMDHCDPNTLLPLSIASPSAQFVGPPDVLRTLAAAGIAMERLHVTEDAWIPLGKDLRVHPVPASHPSVDVDELGRWRCVGYVLESSGKRIYHSGDTSLNETLFRKLEALKPINVAILAVNEHNYYRERQGIVGNMTVREALQFATDLGVEILVPMHWDMFAPNCVYPEEIELLYRLIHPPFQLVLSPSEF